TCVGQLTLEVMAARSEVTRLHMAASPGPLVLEVLPATYRAASRAASEVATANEQPRPIPSTPAMRMASTGRAMANTTSACPARVRPRRRSALEAGQGHPRDVPRPARHGRVR